MRVVSSDGDSDNRAWGELPQTSRDQRGHPQCGTEALLLSVLCTRAAERAGMQTKTLLEDLWESKLAICGMGTRTDEQPWNKAICWKTSFLLGRSIFSVKPFHCWPNIWRPGANQSEQKTHYHAVTDPSRSAAHPGGRWGVWLLYRTCVQKVKPAWMSQTNGQASRLPARPRCEEKERNCVYHRSLLQTAEKTLTPCRGTEIRELWPSAQRLRVPEENNNKGRNLTATEKYLPSYLTKLLKNSQNLIVKGKS